MKQLTKPNVPVIKNIKAIPLHGPCPTIFSRYFTRMNPEFIKGSKTYSAKAPLK